MSNLQFPVGLDYSDGVDVITKVRGHLFISLGTRWAWVGYSSMLCICLHVK